MYYYNPLKELREKALKSVKYLLKINVKLNIEKLDLEYALGFKI